MADLICESCGERNPPGAEFCSSCNAFLAWDPTRITDGATQRLPNPVTGPRPAPPRPAPGRPVPRFPLGGPPGPSVQPGPPRRSGPVIPDGPTQLLADPTPRLKATVDPGAVTITPGREPAAVTVQVFNLSTIVDGYVVEVVDPPPWLVAAPAEIRLLPATDEAVRLTLSIPGAPMVPAAEHQLTVGVRSVSHVEIRQTFPLALTVGVIDGPIELTVQPSLSRIRDVETARIAVRAENLIGNRAVPLVLSGSDPEGVVRFTFDPPVLTVPPGGTASARVQLTAPAPAAGQEVSRALTITATEGTREVTALGTLIQSTSAHELSIAVEPSLLKIRDTGGADLTATVSNPGTGRPLRVRVHGTDPERVVRFTCQPGVLTVPAGGSTLVRIHLEAPQPDPGQEITRQLTIVASDDQREVSAPCALTQRTSPQVTSLRMEPSLVRVRDSFTGFVQVIADNRASPRPIRLALGGSDPERVVRFFFTPPTLDIAAGGIETSWVQVDAPVPEPGREVSRPITVHGSSPTQNVEVTGTFVQVSSPPAIDVLALRLEPSVVRTQDGRSGRFMAVADNREGELPVQIFLDGSDAEGVVAFSFTPQVLQVPPGSVAAAEVRIRAPRPERGQQATRQLTISASDERRTVTTSGSFVQQAGDWRPTARIVLTLLGALAMIAGVFLPWTTSPVRLAGIDWSLPEFAAATRVSLNSLNIREDVLRQIPHQFLSAGLVVLIFAALTLFGLTGSKGRLTRAMGALVLVFLVAFVVAFMVRATDFSPGPGILLVAFGAVCAFVGGLFARR